MAQNILPVQTINRSQGTPGTCVGRLTTDATAITATDYVEVVTGFKPKYVKFINVTDRISVENWEGMADDTCIKAAAVGTVTLETTNQGVTFTNTGFRISQNATLAVIAASKVFQFVAVG